MGELGTGETWSQIHIGGQHFQIQADTARMSVAQGSVGTQRQMFRNVSAEERTCEPRQEGLARRVSQAEPQR